MRKPAHAAGGTVAPNGSRVAIFTQAFDVLVESLDAMIRVDAWRDPEPVPDPLKTSAAQLVVRLGTANRLAAGRFSGSIADTARVRAIADAVRCLDAAYLVYVQDPDRARAAETLSAVIVNIKAVV
jgi:hypothetical protein